MENVHGLFKLWFMVGWILMLVVAITSSINCILKGQYTCPKSKCMARTAIIIFSLLTLAWWITGMVWRFRDSGRFASGNIIPSGITSSDWDMIINAEDSFF